MVVNGDQFRFDFFQHRYWNVKALRIFLDSEANLMLLGNGCLIYCYHTCF